MSSNLPSHFQKAIKTLESLKELESFLGVFIFGSAVRGEVTADSDLDVRAIVSNRKTCAEINHPFILNIKLDISFNSYEEIKKETKTDIENSRRIPMIAESIILFDKTGQLKQLKKLAQKSKPKKITKNDHSWIQFMVYHATNKAARHLISDPLSALLSMDSNLEEMLKFHYQINRRWWLSNKRLLKDIRDWDPKLNLILEKFLQTHDVMSKYHHWQEIIKHILEPLGGPKPISETNCDCPICQKHLHSLTDLR
jgi:predicted nucleotidyltransferase